MEKQPAPLLETYEEARLLLTAKGWAFSKAAEQLQAMEKLSGFPVSQASLTHRTSPGSNYPIESEVAAAVEGMETLGGYDWQAEIVTAGLRAVHGDPPIVDVRQLAKDLREHFPTDEIAQRLVASLEEKAGQDLLEDVACSIADRLRATSLFQEIVEMSRQLTWNHFAIPAGVGALVACLVLLLAPTVPSRALAAPSAGSLVLIIPGAALDGSPLWFEPASLLAMGEKRPAEQQVPAKTLPGQKVAPCDVGLGQEEIYGNCWAWQGAVKPPCGRLFRHGDKCYAPIAADSRKPVELTPDR